MADTVASLLRFQKGENSFVISITSTLVGTVTGAIQSGLEVIQFNAWARAGCLNQHWFMDLDEVRRKVEDRRSTTARETAADGWLSQVMNTEMTCGSRATVSLFDMGIMNPITSRILRIIIQTSVTRYHYASDNSFANCNILQKLALL